MSSEKENDVATVVVTIKSRKRLSAAISLVTPTRPSSSASGGGDDGEPPVASSSPSATPPSRVASSPPSASLAPQVFDLLNIGTDDFSIIRLSLFN